MTRKRLAPRGRLATVAARGAGIAAHGVLGLFRNPQRFFHNGEQRRPRIGFQAFATHLAPFFEPLIGELRRDGTADLVFVLLDHPHFPRDEMRRLKAMAIDRFGLQPNDVRPSWDCRWERFDLMLYADLYARFPSRSSANGLLLHGTPNPDRCFTRGAFRKTVYDFDFALVFGEYDQEQFHRRKPASSAGLRVHAVGCPLLDRMLAPSRSRAEYLIRLGLDPARQTVLYAPHWSLLDGYDQNFPGLLLETVRAMAHPERNLILKPHRMTHVYPSRRPLRWEELAQAGGGNVALDAEQEDLLALLHSDVLVSDISTRLFTFMWLDKPAVVFAPGFVPTGEFESERQRLLEEAFARAESVDALACRIQEALRSPQEASARRLRVASFCFSNRGRSTAEALRVVKQELEGVKRNRR